MGVGIMLILCRINVCNDIAVLLPEGRFSQVQRIAPCNRRALIGFGLDWFGIAVESMIYLRVAMLTQQ